MGDSKEPVQQVFNGPVEQVAGRDVVNQEITMIAFADWLMMASDADRDRLAVKSEVYFQDRFKFTPPPSQRSVIVKIKQDADFSDREVTLLQKHRLLRERKGTYQLKAAPLNEAAGSVLFIACAFYALLFLSLFLFHKTLDLKSMAVTAGGAAGFFGFGLYFIRSEVAPSRLARRGLRKMKGSAQ